MSTNPRDTHDDWTRRFLGRVADLPRQGERTEYGGVNMAQLDVIVLDARRELGQPERRPDYDAD